MNHIQLGQQIRSIRRSKGVTATHVANNLGFKTVSAYTRYEIGGGRIPAVTLKKVADILGVSMEDFFSPEFARYDKMPDSGKEETNDHSKAG